MWLPAPLSPNSPYRAYFLSLPQPPAPPLTISGVCPSQKVFLHHLSHDPTTARQTSRWAIWLAVSLCLFPCCRDVRWDKTLFCCICHVLSAGFIRNEKSLGYRTCGGTDWPTAVIGVPLHYFFNTFSSRLFLFLTICLSYTLHSDYTSAMPGFNLIIQNFRKSTID